MGSHGPRYVSIDQGRVSIDLVWVSIDQVRVSIDLVWVSIDQGRVGIDLVWGSIDPDVSAFTCVGPALTQLTGPRKTQLTTGFFFCD